MKNNREFRYKLHEIIFEADTPAGKRFDIVLLIMISLSVIVVMLESVQSIQIGYGKIFTILEWIFTLFFTVEYILRLYSVRSPKAYALSFYGVIDLLSILPTYLSIFITGAHSLMVIRALRLLRIFRVLKLGNLLHHSRIISSALRTSKDKILVFLFAVLILVMILGSVMYLIEGGRNDDFDSIPRSVYWAIATLTTVGYGDITPSTSLGQFVSAIIMILGYAIIAVPTGIVSSELIKQDNNNISTQACPSCSKENHDMDATYCKHCGSILEYEDS